MALQKTFFKIVARIESGALSQQTTMKTPSMPAATGTQDGNQTTGFPRFHIKSQLNKCDFKFYFLNYLQRPPPPQKETPQRRINSQKHSKNTDLLRHAP
jgi:hypothetical protein